MSATSIAPNVPPDDDTQCDPLNISLLPAINSTQEIQVMAEGPSQDGNLSPLQRDIAHGAAAGASTEVAQAVGEGRELDGNSGGGVPILYPDPRSTHFTPSPGDASDTVNSNAVFTSSTQLHLLDLEQGVADLTPVMQVLHDIMRIQQDTLAVWAAQRPTRLTMGIAFVTVIASAVTAFATAYGSFRQSSDSDG